jgi:hypothetical protein
MIKKYVFIVFFITSGLITAVAQSLSPTVLSFSGGFGSSGGTSLSWTAGELMIQTFSDGSVMLTQGFHQGDITVSTAVDEMRKSAMDVHIYPNPVSDMLDVEFKNMVDYTIQVRLVDLTGKTVLRKEISQPSNRLWLNLSSVSSGTYMLEIRAADKRKVFKIVKH